MISLLFLIASIIILISFEVHSPIGLVGCMISFCMTMGAIAFTYSMDKMTDVLKEISKKLDNIAKDRR